MSGGGGTNPTAGGRSLHARPLVFGFWGSPCVPLKSQQLSEEAESGPARGPQDVAVPAGAAVSASEPGRGEPACAPLVDPPPPSPPQSPVSVDLPVTAPVPTAGTVSPPGPDTNPAVYQPKGSPAPRTRPVSLERDFLDNPGAFGKPAPAKRLGAAMPGETKRTPQPRRSQESQVTAPGNLQPRLGQAG